MMMIIIIIIITPIIKQCNKTVLIFLIPATPATQLTQADVELDWIVVSDELFFQCIINTTHLDPVLDILDVTFTLGDTVLKSFTNISHSEVAQLPATFFERDYNDSTKLAYNKKVSIVYIY